ncbi:MAG TPA: MFS transporter [Coxiellaceae bacterium]|nr:MAG: hypothetical protein A3E81_07735 [Gammaproteobacteria bacterium RIFCSPHIGHO2_12_FULL_36_30]HLB57048.1 MFS transporter [Coxiellaceae bacterium]
MRNEKLTDWGASIGIFLAYTGNYIYLPLLISKLGVEYSGFWAGFIICMTYVGRVSATFFYSFISKKYGIRNTISLFVLIEGIALFGMGFSNTRMIYSLLALCIGFASGISFPSLKHMLSSLPEKVRLSAFSRFQLASQAGLIIGAIIGSIWVGPQMSAVFLVVFLFFLSYAFIIFIFVPADHKDKIIREDNNKVSLLDFSMLKNVRFPAIKYDLFLSLFYWFLFMSFMVDMPLYIKSYLPILSVSMPFWLTGSVLLLFQMSFSKYAEKTFGTSATLAIGCVALFFGFTAFCLDANVICIVIGCILIALGQIFFTPALDILVSRSVGKENMGKAMSAMHFYRSCGNMLGTLCAGILFDLGRTTHMFNLSWIAYAVIAFSLAIACVALGKSKVSENQISV